jgi:hypothetical protein
MGRVRRTSDQGDHNPCVAYVRCGIFTRRIFASAQRLRRVASFGSYVHVFVAFAQRTCAYLWLSIGIHASTLAVRIMRG